MAKLETQQKIDELKKTLAELEESLLVPEKSKEDLMEELFLSLISNTKYKIEGVNNNWYNDKDEWLIAQEKNYKQICFSYDRVWSIFSIKFNDNDYETKQFLSTMVVKHLDLQGYTTCLH